MCCNSTFTTPVGRLGRADVSALFNRIGYHPSDFDVELFMDEFDQDGHGIAHDDLRYALHAARLAPAFHEFEQLALSGVPLLDAFAEADVQQTGTVNFQAFLRLCGRLGITSHRNALRELFDTFATARRSLLRYEEFVKHCLHRTVPRILERIALPRGHGRQWAREAFNMMKRQLVVTKRPEEDLREATERIFSSFGKHPGVLTTEPVEESSVLSRHRLPDK